MSDAPVSPLLLEARRLTSEGVRLVREGRLADGLQALREAATLLPGEPAVHANVAAAAERVGDPEAAIASWYRALLCAPTGLDLYRSLAGCLARAGRAEPAALAERVVAAADGAGFGAPGTIAAVEALRRAIAPADVELPTRLGGRLLDQDQPAAAVGYYRLAREGAPTALGPLANLMLACRRARWVDEAMAAADALLAIAPGNAEARLFKAQRLLESGAYAEGWRQFEAFWELDRAEGRAPDWVRRGRFWTGEPTGDRIVGLWGAGGFGDMLQFARYVPLLGARGIRCALMVPAPLVRLFRQSGLGEVRDVAEPADFPLCCPLERLPTLFGTTLATIPPCPYLTADADAVAAWRARLDGAPPRVGPRVGLVWAGAAGTEYDHRRSVPLAALEPLLGVAGLDFISLQVGDRAAEAAAYPAIRDISADLPDFAETGAAIQALDLVIGVDTAVLHLAGALGRPAWLLNRFDSCWRWLAGRTDSPWYPSLRIVQQGAPGDWAGVVAAVAAALAAWRDEGAGRGIDRG